MTDSRSRCGYRWAGMLGLMLAACTRPEPPAPDPAPAVATASPETLPEPGKSRMDRDEEASESIANWLLGLATAVRDRHYESVAAYFADDFSGDLLAEPGAVAKPAVPGFETLSWELPADAKGKLHSGDMEATFRRWFGRW